MAREQVAAEDELVSRLLDQLRQVCVTGEEAPLADVVADRYDRLGEPVRRIGESLVVGGTAGDDSADDRPLVLLVGHLDVVPPTGQDSTPRIEDRADGPVVVGRGASDMKAGNVVAMACFEDAGLRAASPYRMALVLYAGEEGPAENNQLPTVLDEVGWLADADLAVVLEPTDGQIQLGCLGGLHASVTFSGRRAHSARPWHGVNALTKAGAFLAELHDEQPRAIDVDGVRYHDVWSATQAVTDTAANPRARNVIPASFTINLNLRFAPDRSLADAEQQLRSRVGDRATVEIVDRTPPAPPRLDAPLVVAFVDAVGAEVAGKQAWTDVARLTAAGIPALNYGPGLTAQAHRAGEHIPVAALEVGYRSVRRFLIG